MLKSMLTLVRGATNNVVEATLDQNSFILLDQQTKDFADLISSARKSLAISTVQNCKLDLWLPIDRYAAAYPVMHCCYKDVA